MNLGGNRSDPRKLRYSAATHDTQRLIQHNMANSGVWSKRVTGSSVGNRGGVQGGGQQGLPPATLGALMYGNVANVWVTLPFVATPTRYLANTGAGTTPTWAQINLSNGVTGVLPTGNGGTGLSVPGASGNVLTSNGTNWVSSTPGSAPPPWTSTITPTNSDTLNLGAFDKVWVLYCVRLVDDSNGEIGIGQFWQIGAGTPKVHQVGQAWDDTIGSPNVGFAVTRSGADLILAVTNNEAVDIDVEVTISQTTSF